MRRSRGLRPGLVAENNLVCVIRVNGVVEMKKALITGIIGQDGPYLAEFLLAKG